MTLAAVMVIAAAGVRADGEHSRRLAAEVVISMGDAGRLADPDTPDLHKQGLRARIGGSLGSLGLLVRRARQERPRPAPPDGWRAKLQDAFAAGDMAQLRAGLEALSRLYPLDLTGVLPAPLTPARERSARALNEELCAGCHDSPDLEVALPAFDLFQQARGMDVREFAARLISGIRGDSVTNLQNPFTDEDIAAFIAFYRKGTR